MTANRALAALLGLLGALAVFVAISTEPTQAQRGPTRQTYVAGLTIKTATAAGTTPFFTICGSASRPVVVQQFVVSGTVGTAAVYGDVVLQRTSTTTTSGTATALTQTRMDTQNRAPTASKVNYYTVLATVGTLVGTVASRGAVFPITATVAASEAQIVFDWRAKMPTGDLQAPVLRGVSECLEASFATTTTNAPTLQVEVMWSED